VRSRPPPTQDSTPGPTEASSAGRVERLARLTYQAMRELRAIARRWEARAPRVIAVLRLVFYPCALALVGYMAYRAARETDLSKLHYWPLAAAVGAAIIWWMSLALGWASLIGGAPWAAVASWSRTQVARYLPGGIWAVVARATTVQGRVRDKLTAVTAENVIVLLVALAVGGLWASVHDWRWLPLVLLVAAPLLASRWLEQRTKITRRGVRRTAATYAVGYLAYGVLGVLVQVAVSGVRDPTYPLYVAGAACVAWAVGLVVVFAPGGVGVRELVYIWMLSGLYPMVELEAAAVTMRLVTVLAEFTVFALVSRPAVLRPKRRPADQRAGPAHERT
jgi:glycosyltransferase 2 family protein